MNKNEPYYVLGLTPDISSCGFALLDMNNQEICEMGSHLFKAPVDNKTKTSLAAARRSARSARRNNMRNKNRQKHCLQLLKKQGLVPEEADKTWMQTKKGDKPTIRLRKKALDHLLTDRELAQVLYALSKHRGYMFRGTETADDDAGPLNDEDGKVLRAIKVNLDLMASGGYRTVGEMLYAEGKSRNKQKRGDGYQISVLNEQLVDEVKNIFESQAKLGSSLVSTGFLEDYLAAMQWTIKSFEHDQRIYRQVGACCYFDDQKRAAKATVSSQLCCAYECLGRIAIVCEDGSYRYLTNQQIDHYLSILFSPQPIKGNVSCKVTYKTIRKDLDLPAASFFKGIDTKEEKTHEPFEPKAWRALRNSSLPEDLMARMFADRSFGDAVGGALTYASTEDSLCHQLEGLDLADEEIKRLCQTPFAGKTFGGYDERSLKALDLLLDSFMDADARTTLSEAEKASGLQGLHLKDTSARYDLLPAYQVFDPACKNPVVLHAMARMRRIVNAVIRLYGVPNEIHIALGSDLKQSGNEKRKIERAKRAAERANKGFRAEAAVFLECEEEAVAGRILRKMALYEEQNQHDIYTNEVIDKKRMICDDDYCRIDYILPYCRTCDDSRANKVLVLAKTNEDKDNLTPYEWMTQKEDSPDWDVYRERIMATVASAKKKRYLLDTTLGEDDNEAHFIDRNLNDTRYRSSMTKDYLEQSLVFSGDGRIRHVHAVSGGLAANFRYMWGLNVGHGETKEQSDHVRPAVEACVIAGCSYSSIQKMTELRNQGKETFMRLRKAKLVDTQPWDTFSQDVLSRKEQVVPTFAVNYGVTGQLFEETLYHFDGTNGNDYPIVRANGKCKAQGNIHFVTDSSLRLVGGVAFVRLWFDPASRPNGKVMGRYYAEPVYYADFAAIANGTYTPRAVSIGKPRIEWKLIPQTALSSKPLYLRFGTVVVVDGFIGRYRTLSINGLSWEFESLKSGKHFRKGVPPTISSLGLESDIRIIQEDVLGHCYTAQEIHLINEVESEFENQ